MFSQILAAIAAIPKLLGAIQELISFFKKAEELKWFSQKTEAMQAIDKAETDEEFREASKKLNDTLRGL